MNTGDPNTPGKVTATYTATSFAERVQPILELEPPCREPHWRALAQEMAKVSTPVLLNYLTLSKHVYCFQLRCSLLAELGTRLNQGLQNRWTAEAVWLAGCASDCLWDLALPRLEQVTASVLATPKPLTAPQLEVLWLLGSIYWGTTQQETAILVWGNVLNSGQGLGHARRIATIGYYMADHYRHLYLTWVDYYLKQDPELCPYARAWLMLARAAHLISITRMREAVGVVTKAGLLCRGTPGTEFEQMVMTDLRSLHAEIWHPTGNPPLSAELYALITRPFKERPFSLTALSQAAKIASD